MKPPSKWRLTTAVMGVSPLAAATCQGPVAREAEAAFGKLVTDQVSARLLAITAPDRLHAGWLAARRARRTGDRGAVSWVETLLAPLDRGAAMVTVLDGHPGTHA